MAYQQPGAVRAEPARLCSERVGVPGPAAVDEAFAAALAWAELQVREPEPGAWDWAAEAEFHERVLARQLAAAAQHPDPFEDAPAASGTVR